MGPRVVHSRATFELSELTDDFTWSVIMKLDLNGSSSINRTNDVADIRISSLEKKIPATSQNLLLGKKYLLVRQPTMADSDQVNASFISEPITRYAIR